MALCLEVFVSRYQTMDAHCGKLRNLFVKQKCRGGGVTSSTSSVTWFVRYLTDLYEIT